MTLPVSRSTGPVAGNVALPVYAEEEATATGVEGGAATPYYAVTDADLASGKFVVAGGSPTRVAVARGTRPVMGGPAIPMRRVAGTMSAAAFGDELYGRVLATSPASLLSYFRLTEVGGSGGGAAANSKPAGAAGTYGTAVNRGAAAGVNGYRCPTFSHTASTDYVDILSSLGGWNGNLFSILIYGRIPNASDWTDAALNFARLIDIRTDANNSFFLGKYDSTTNSTYLSFELKAAGASNFAGFSVGATTSDFSVLITNNQAANRFRIYFNGAQVINGATPGLWSGALTTAYIGASYALFSNWKGYLYDCAVWNSELTAAP